MDGKILGVIPARGGSKSIPHKNIVNLLGQPLIAYTIELANLALNEGILDRVIVSTDDNNIADVSRKYGGDVPFMRPKELAGDGVPDKPVLKHALEWIEKKEKIQVSYVVKLVPTSPLRKFEDLVNVINKIKATGCDSVRTVCEVTEHPYWMKKISGDVLLPFMDGKDEKIFFQKQLLPKIYIINGAIDTIKKSVFYEYDFLYGDDIRCVIMPKSRSIDIDDMIDLQIAEVLLNNDQ